MAKAPKNGKSGPTETVATTLLLPPTKTVQDLAKMRRNTKKRTQSLSGEFGTEVGKAVENKHLDRKAHAIACQLDAMDDQKLHVTYFHLLKYLDDLEIPKRAKAQEELFDEHKPKGEAGETAEEPGAGAADGNVRHIGSAARKVAEAAGADR